LPGLNAIFLNPVLSRVTAPFPPLIGAILAPIPANLTLPILPGFDAIFALLANILPAVTPRLHAVLSAILPALLTRLAPILASFLAQGPPNDASAPAPYGPVVIAILVHRETGHEEGGTRWPDYGCARCNRQITAGGKSIAPFPADLAPPAIAGEDVHGDPAWQHIDYAVAGAGSCPYIEVCLYDGRNC
jgi:hypothetical protein